MSEQAAVAYPYSMLPRGVQALTGMPSEYVAAPPFGSPASGSAVAAAAADGSKLASTRIASTAVGRSGLRVHVCPLAKPGSPASRVRRPASRGLVPIAPSWRKGRGS